MLFTIHWNDFAPTMTYIGEFSSYEEAYEYGCNMDVTPDNPYAEMIVQSISQEEADELSERQSLILINED